MFASGRMRRRYCRAIVLALVSYRTVAQENVVTHDSRAVREIINVALSFFENNLLSWRDRCCSLWRRKSKQQEKAGTAPFPFL